MAQLAIVSFRLGGTDGVAIEAMKWQRALEQLGHDVTTVAGEGMCDVLLPGLAMSSLEPPTLDELDVAFANVDVVIVENLASLPLNPAARDVLYKSLEGRRALFHHHDLAWQREHLAHLGGPLDRPEWRHVAINQLSVDQLADRGIRATLLRNSFDCTPPPGRRASTRKTLGVDDERLVLMPTRALARKNVAGALRLARELGATLWLLGPTEDGFDDELSALLAGWKVRVLRGLGDATIHDAYAACDLVVIPSTWEGFGNPVLESVTHQRPLALNWYPVAREIASYGFHFFGLDDIDDIVDFLERPNVETLTRNLEIARLNFNVLDLPVRLAAILEEFEKPPLH